MKIKQNILKNINLKTEGLQKMVRIHGIELVF